MKFKKWILIGIFLVASILRLWKLADVPVSLFGDELDVGYQAYSILKTGRDYYGNFMPIHFHSLAEWRAPLYLYSSVPTVTVFGITPLGVRLPAAIFGILGVIAFYFLVKELTKYSGVSDPDDKFAIIAAALLGLSPWHIQYSRAAFEVTELLLFLILGLIFFFKSISPKGSNEKYMWLSVTFLILTPWIYSTAKLFTLIIMIFLFVMFKKEILSISKKNLLKSIVAGLIVGLPIAYSTVFGGGAQRFDYIGIFTDPTMESEVGTDRLNDARARGEIGTGLNPTLFDRATHNKFTFIGDNFLRNYLQPFSADFLFNSGDPNPRHTIHEMGQLYKVEIIPFILGIILFFSSKKFNSKTKLFIAFWLLAGILPASLTRDGGNHATRLILILPPLIFLVAYGFKEGLELLNGRNRKIAFALYSLLFIACFFFYQHNYWIHNPTYSERWWHAGFGEAVGEVKKVDRDFDKVVISTNGEPPWIFFAAWYEYPPRLWQKNFPIGNDIEVAGLGKVSHIDKFMFGSYSGGLYEWGKTIDNKTLFLATAKDVNVNLILEPNRTPGDLKLIKAITYPSGEPAFYLFTGNK